MYVLSKKRENITFFRLKITIFAAVKNLSILHGHVCVMMQKLIRKCEIHGILGLQPLLTSWQNLAVKTFKRKRVGQTDLFRIINPLLWPFFFFFGLWERPWPCSLREPIQFYQRLCCLLINKFLWPTFQLAKQPSLSLTLVGISEERLKC